MLRELTKADWLSILQLDEAQIPPVLILRGTRNLRRHFDRYRALLTAPIDVGSPNGLFEDVVIGERDGRRWDTHRSMGRRWPPRSRTSSAVLGTRAVIQTGVCGGLADGVTAGDLVIATEAGCGEGAVDCYLPGTTCVSASETTVSSACRD